MKSVNGINWQINSIPERLILKNQQNFNISYLLSKIFLDNKYTDEEIHNSIYKTPIQEINYQNHDFENAANLVTDCLINKKKILIFGDYDVDGYSSTYLLYDYFITHKLNCDYFIPDRLSDGYGPNVSLLRKLISKSNYDLVIFVDCGSNSIDEITYLENCGLKCIVIDHHQIYKHKFFNKSVIINPLKRNLPKKYNTLCATSLTYFFIKYLVKKLNSKKKIDINKYLFFSAIATICDQMPLRDYNKKIVIKGLRNFDLNKFYNFKKLIKINRKLTSTDISFILGPIMNSASRIGYSDLPFKLLIEKKGNVMDRIISRLINLNEKRKKIQSKTINLLKINLDEIKNQVIFKYVENINEGLLGIIASNFVEIYNRPSFILTNSGDFIKCSSRSIKDFDIGYIFYLAFKKKIIINGGGHSMAGGCILKKNKLNEFKRFLNLNYNRKFYNTIDTKYYTSIQNYESLLTFAKEDFQNLEPLGNDNGSPFFLVKNNKIVKLKVINYTHLQFILKNKNNKSYKGMAFNAVGRKLGECLMNCKKEIDLIVQINNNIIHKNSDFNLIIKDAIV